MSILLNNHKIIPSIFPDGTSQVWKLPNNWINPTDNNIVEWNFEKEDEFLHLAQLIDLVNTQCQFHPILKIPYFPYARQDKEISNYTTFAKNTFEKLISILKVKRIETFDIHSPSTLTNLININPVKEIENVIAKTSPTLVVYPDKGAYTRYSKLIDYPSITLNKYRDQLTGKLEMKGILPPDDDLLINGDRINLFKDPITDSNKKSHKGLMKLDKINSKFITLDEQTSEAETEGFLIEVFNNGKITKKYTLEEIKNNSKINDN